MRMSLFPAGVFASILIRYSIGLAQQTASPAASPVVSASSTVSPSPAPSVSPATESSAAPPRLTSTKLLYKPPTEAGNIPTRVSTAARGEAGADTTLLPLVPDHLALTTQAQPSFFWFQSKPAKARFDLTVVEPKNPKSLLSLTSSRADKPGIDQVKLTRHGVELQPDVVYEWSVAIVPDAENRSKDLVAKGVIKRVKPSDALARQLETPNDLERASIYAQAGIWYDALATISNAIEAHPNDASLREQRASLLKQVGLSEAAALDKKK